VIVEHALRLVLGPEIDAGDVDVLHQIDDGAPAGLVELVLQRVARGVTARAVVDDELLEAAVVGGVLGQRRDREIAGQLPKEILHRLEREVLVPGRAEIDLAPGGLERQRLRPDAVLARGQRREIVVAGSVGEDRGGDGPSLGLGGNRHAAHLLAGRRADRASQQRVGGAGRARSNQCREARDGDEAGAQPSHCFGGRAGKPAIAPATAGARVVHGVISLFPFCSGFTARPAQALPAVAAVAARS
jgi:hypothetical protein